METPCTTASYPTGCGVFLVGALLSYFATIGTRVQEQAVNRIAYYREVVSFPHIVTRIYFRFTTAEGYEFYRRSTVPVQYLYLNAGYEYCYSYFVPGNNKYLKIRLLLHDHLTSGKNPFSFQVFKARYLYKFNTRRVCGGGEGWGQ